MAEERVWTTAEYASTANFTVHDGVMTVRRVGRISRLIFFSFFSFFSFAARRTSLAFESLQLATLLLGFGTAFLSAKPRKKNLISLLWRVQVRAFGWAKAYGSERTGESEADKKRRGILYFQNHLMRR